MGFRFPLWVNRGRFDQSCAAEARAEKRLRCETEKGSLPKLIGIREGGGKGPDFRVVPRRGAEKSWES